MGKDPVATEAVTALALGHQPYGQMVLPIAAKAGQGTMGINNINVRGESLASIQRYCKVAPGDFWLHPDLHAVAFESDTLHILGKLTLTRNMTC